MTSYADLTPYTYDRDNWQPDATGLWSGLPLLHVGRLDRGKPYAEGTTPDGLADMPRDMTRTHRAEQTRGFHVCPWCAAEESRARTDCPRGRRRDTSHGEGSRLRRP